MFEPAARDPTKRQMPMTVNPVEDCFIKQRIAISDMKPPIAGQTIHGKKFIDCELVGAAIIGFLGGSLEITGNQFSNCDFVKTRDDALICNVLLLENVTIRGCRLYHLTILVPARIAHLFPAGDRWITA